MINNICFIKNKILIMGIFTKQKEYKNAFVAYLNLLGVKYTQCFSNKYFNEHPHKYSLFGLSKMLSEFNIENVAAKVSDKEQSLFELETPFIAHTGADFVVVSKITSEKVHYIWNGKDIDVSLDKFIQSWTNVVLLAEVNEASKEPEYEKHIAAERILALKKTMLWVVCLLFLSIIFINQSINIETKYVAILLFNLIGIWVTYLLIQKQMKTQSNYADKICSLFKQSDCNNILESDAAKFFGVVSWSEIGLGYFISNIAVLLFLPHLISYLLLINACALPYTLWSLWYQMFKAKQWCPLCLIVQGLLWAIFIANILFERISLPMFNIMDALFTVCIYTIPILIINIFVDSLSESENVENIRQEINSIKATEEVFEVLLKQQPHYNVSKESSKILFGNPESKNLITVLTNPHCNPCAKMHKNIEAFLEKGNNNLCMQYIFTSFSEELDSSSHFLISAYMNRPNEWEEIINAWFENGKNDKANFFKRYSFKIEETVLEEFQRHERWKQEAMLSSTPTILINGYKLPENYKIDDLKYFTDLVVDAK